MSEAGGMCVRRIWGGDGGRWIGRVAKVNSSSGAVVVGWLVAAQGRGTSAIVRRGRSVRSMKSGEGGEGVRSRGTDLYFSILQPSHTQSELCV